jgi:hypothetical protein
VLTLPKNEFYYCNMYGLEYSGNDMKVIKQCGGGGVVASKLQRQVVI